MQSDRPAQRTRLLACAPKKLLGKTPPIRLLTCRPCIQANPGTSAI